MSSSNLPCVTQSLSVISFHDYLHYCGIFLVHHLMEIDRNIISSLPIVFSLCARVGWCDVCICFTKVIKVDVDVNEMSLLIIWIMCTIGGLGRHIGRQLTDSRPMVNRYIDRLSADASADM